MGLPGSYSSQPGTEVPPDSSILGVEGLGLGGAKLGVSVCPEFPEGAGEPTSCRGFVLPESLGSPVCCTVVSLPSLPPPPPPPPRTPHSPPCTARPTRPCPGHSKSPSARHQARLWEEMFPSVPMQLNQVYV